MNDGSSAVTNDPSLSTCRRQRRSKRRKISDLDSADMKQAPRKYPHRSDEEIAQCVARKIIYALEDSAKAPLCLYQQALENEYPKLPGETEKDARLRIEQDLSLRGKSTTGVIRWANNFYSSCMRYVLRERRELSGDKDRAAKIAHSINMTVNELCASGPPDALEHLCGNKVYAGLASKRSHLSYPFPY